MKAQIPTLEQCFERLNGYLDKTSRLDSSFEWNHQTREDVLSLLGFKPWIKINAFNDSEPPECYTNQVWLHPRGLYAITSPSDEMFDFSSSKTLPLGYFKMIGNDNLEKNIVSFFNENPLFLNKKSSRFDCFKMFLNNLESDLYLSLFQCFNKVYNEKKLNESLFSKNKIISSRGYRF